MFGSCVEAQLPPTGATVEVESVGSAHAALCRAARLLLRGDVPSWCRRIIWTELGHTRQLLHLLGPDEDGTGAPPVHLLPQYAYACAPGASTALLRPGTEMGSKEARAIVECLRSMSAARYLAAGKGEGEAATTRSAAHCIALRQLARWLFARSAPAGATGAGLGWGRRQVLLSAVLALGAQQGGTMDVLVLLLREAAPATAHEGMGDGANADADADIATLPLAARLQVVRDLVDDGTATGAELSRLRGVVAQLPPIV